MNEVPVEGKEDGSIFNSKGCDKGIGGGQGDTMRAGKPNQGGGIPIRLEAPRLKQIPKAQVTFDGIYITAKSLEHLCNDETA